MDKKEDIKKILELMGCFMHSMKVQNQQPWKRLKLTREQLRIVFLLSRKTQSSPGEIAKDIGVPKANVTNVINRLVGKGLVSRKEHPNDRRSYLLTLTTKGKNQIIQLLKLHTITTTRILERMPEDTLVYLARGLEELVKVAKEERGINGNNQSK